MSVITFWSNGIEQTGKTSAIVAIATHIAIEHNSRILVISTGYNDNTLTNCFWRPNNEKKNMGIFGPNTNAGMEDGISGVHKMLKSGRLSPEMLTNYSKIALKDRLEILTGYSGSKSHYDEIKDSYLEIINMASKFYDLVLVDLDKQLNPEIKNEILQNSDIVVATISQRLASIDAFMREREDNGILKSKKTLILIGRYDKYSKYTVKNISRYMREKNKVSTLPYNTLFFEACEEAKVPDLFFKIRNISEDDRNGFFLSEVKRISENIIYRLQDLQMKM